jgi:hypothetical protein
MRAEEQASRSQTCEALSSWIHAQVLQGWMSIHTYILGGYDGAAMRMPVCIKKAALHTVSRGWSYLQLLDGRTATKGGWPYLVVCLQAGEAALTSTAAPAARDERAYQQADEASGAHNTADDDIAVAVAV